MTVFLFEDLTFDQLFRYSEPKRIKRAQKVRGPPLDIRAHSNAIYHIFNFKAFPSTTGLRHHGYVKFKRPEFGNARRPLQHIPCEVDCTCPDYRYRFAWVNKQRRAGRVGAGTMNQAHNRAPNITNPRRVPGLCKHILAAREFIYGMISRFPGGPPDMGDSIGALVKYADRRWQNMDVLMAKAKDSEKWYDAIKQATNDGHAGDLDYTYRLYRARGGQDIGVPRGVPAPVAPMAFNPRVPPPPPEEAPPLPAPEPAVRPPRPRLPAAAAQAVPAAPTTKKKPKSVMTNITPPGKRGRTLPSYGESLQRFLAARVIRITASTNEALKLTENMKPLEQALVLIQEVTDAEVKAPSELASTFGANGSGDEPSMDGPPPSEPPVSDEAVGADTEGNVALQLLSDIRDLLNELVHGGEEGAPGEEGGEPPLPPGEEGAEDSPVDAVPMPDEEDEDDNLEPPTQRGPQPED